MPPKKPIQRSVAQLFQRAEKDLPATVATLTDTMALTKADLVEVLKHFKTELKEELRVDMKTVLSDEIQTLREDLNERLKSLREDIDSAGTRLLDLEQRTQSMDQKLDTVIPRMATTQQNIDLMQLKLEDLENRSRRDNIRIKHLEENVEGTDMSNYVQRLFQSLIPENTNPIRIDRVHRVGRPDTRSNRGPRDVLVKLHDFRTKEDILLAARGREKVDFDGQTCALYQDLSAATLARRNEFRPITEKLRTDGIKYRWLHPFGISFELNNQRYQTSLVETAAHILELDLETDSPKNSQGDTTESRAAPTTGVGDRTWRFQRPRRGKR